MFILHKNPEEYSKLHDSQKWQLRSKVAFDYVSSSITYGTELDYRGVIFYTALRSATTNQVLLFPSAHPLFTAFSHSPANVPKGTTLLDAMMLVARDVVMSSIDPSKLERYVPSSQFTPVGTFFHNNTVCAYSNVVFEDCLFTNKDYNHFSRKVSTIQEYSSYVADNGGEVDKLLLDTLVLVKGDKQNA